jgi:uncharacterized protein (DUF924 family)
MNDAAPAGHALEPAWVGEVLTFWFSELQESEWWRKSDALDERIRSRFLALHGQLAAGDDDAVREPRPMLAAVIVLDQFSRNLFRGSSRAFAADPAARRLARQAISAGYDRGLRPEERLFLYLPFEHSEDRADQAYSVELISALGREDWTRYAVAHQVIIERFGRFPHRNAVLGRESTAEEIAALEEPMSSF